MLSSDGNVCQMWGNDPSLLFVNLDGMGWNAINHSYGQQGGQEKTPLWVLIVFFVLCEWNYGLTTKKKELLILFEYVAALLQFSSREEKLRHSHHFVKGSFIQMIYGTQLFLKYIKVRPTVVVALIDLNIMPRLARVNKSECENGKKKLKGKSGEINFGDWLLRLWSSWKWNRVETSSTDVILPDRAQGTY